MLHSRVPLSPIARSRIKIARALAFELVGSERYAYPGLDGLDRLVEPYLAPFPYGTFLEIGAFDGYSKSNTFRLERSGRWHGILIEPLPAPFKLCQRLRTRSRCYNVACVPPDGPKTVRLAERAFMTVAPELVPEGEREERIGPATEWVDAPTMTMSAVIDHSGIGHINFLSLDVEGAELVVLGGLDLARHCPDVLLVETAHPEAIDEAVGAHMRRVEQISYHDYVYLAA